jgi:hypothetical protein
MPQHVQTRVEPSPAEPIGIGERLRFTIQVGTVTRKLISAIVAQNGDLTLDLKPPNFSLDIPPRPPAYGAPSEAELAMIKAATEKGPVRITSDTLTVHPSTRSNGGNLITKKMVLATGAGSRAQYFTKALKTYDQFAPIFFTLYGEHSHGKHIVDDEGRVQTFHLGRIDPMRSSLFAMLFIGNNGRHFRAEPSASYTVIQKTMGSFTLVLIASFISVPLTQHTVNANFYTTNDAADDPHMREMFMSGADEAGCIREFDLSAREALKRYVERTVWNENWAYYITQSARPSLTEAIWIPANKSKRGDS